MKFGHLKSKIEKLLIESYSTNTIKDNMFIFKELVLNKKPISNLYHLYSELSSNKGLNESIADDYINESINLGKTLLTQISKSDLDEIKLWVEQHDTINEYEVIDDLFTDNPLKIESKIKSKNLIKETLIKSSTPIDVPQVPISEMVNIANKNINEHISTLSESDAIKLKKLLEEDDNVLEQKFNFLKENIVDKLTIIKESEDVETQQAITETIDKINNENYSKLNFLKLKDLINSL